MNNTQTLYLFRITTTLFAGLLLFGCARAPEADQLPQGDYLWHGNAVIRGSGSDERLWHGPFLQRLLQTIMDEKPKGREAFQKILDTLEKDPTVPNAKLNGPGAYPGGGDALHPARLGDREGWQESKPDLEPPIE